jgi:hypothetical protein
MLALLHATVGIRCCNSAAPEGMSCHAMQALYAVHPNPLLKAWIIFLRLSEPDIYGRVDYCERLANLNVYFSGGKAPAPPQHVLDYDAEH